MNKKINRATKKELYFHNSLFVHESICTAPDWKEVSFMYKWFVWRILIGLVIVLIAMIFWPKKSVLEMEFSEDRKYISLTNTDFYENEYQNKPINLKGWAFHYTEGVYKLPDCTLLFMERIVVWSGSASDYPKKRVQFETGKCPKEIFIGRSSSTWSLKEIVQYQLKDNWGNNGGSWVFWHGENPFLPSK